jgi:hypothetical protein
LDLYKIEKQDPDPYQSEKQDLNPYQSEKQDPDPYQKGLDPQHWYEDIKIMSKMIHSQRGCPASLKEGKSGMDKCSFVRSL